jgi:hypothetical protein
MQARAIFKTHFQVALLVTVWIIGSHCPAGATTPKAEVLQQKMADIALLSDQLLEKKVEALRIRERLYVHLELLIQEIREESQRRHIKGYPEAMAIPRLQHNLHLASEVKGYLSNFNGKIRFYQIGMDKLDYLYRQADDDLKIVHTLSNLKIEALLSHIDVVVGKYLPEAHTILIDLKDIQYEPPESIWNEVVKAKT